MHSLQKKMRFNFLYDGFSILNYLPDLLWREDLVVPHLLVLRQQPLLHFGNKLTHDCLFCVFSILHSK